MPGMKLKALLIFRKKHLKNGPAVTRHKIAELRNNMATTGDAPKKVKTGILVPLQKLGKKKGLPPNLRPVILLAAARPAL